MGLSFDLDLGIREADPIRQCILLALCMAHADGATAVVLGASQPNGGNAPLRYRLNNDWYDFPPFPVPMPAVAAELERMAGISETVPEGALEHTFDGVKLRWKVQATTPGAEYMLTMLTRIAD